MAEERRLARRDGSIWTDYFNGLTLEAIARKHGITHQRVSQVIARIRESIPDEDKEEQKLLFLEQLRWGTSELAAVFAAGPIPAYSNGRPILDENEEAVPDHSGRWAAWDRILKNQERASKMLGLEAKTETAISIDTTDDVAALLARAQARRAQEE